MGSRRAGKLSFNSQDHANLWSRSDSAPFFYSATSDSRHLYRISPNLLLELPAPTTMNQVWVGDITYIPLRDSCWAYLAYGWIGIPVACWSLQLHMREELVMEALKNAFLNRAVPAGMIIHSDRGVQYASNRFRAMFKKPVIINQSMSRADDPYDNAFMKSYFSRFKSELLQAGVFESPEDARTEIFNYIELYYNPIRRHLGIGYKRPVQFEKEHLSAFLK